MSSAALDGPGRGRSYTRDEIEGCSEVDTLRAWFLDCDRRELELRSFIDAWRAAEVDDEDWFRRHAGALAYCAIGKRWIERRILTLGEMPPYFPTDPRARQLRILNDKVTRLQTRIDELERAATGGDDS